MTNLQVVKSFLEQVFRGEMTQALTLVASDAVFIPSRPEFHDLVPLYGTFRGQDGAAKVFQNFAALLKPGVFQVHAEFEHADHAVMYGHLQHQAQASGNTFSSDWALICKIKQGLIQYYHFYEDTAALEHALAIRLYSAQ